MSVPPWWSFASLESRRIRPCICRAGIRIKQGTVGGQEGPLTRLKSAGKVVSFSPSGVTYAMATRIIGNVSSTSTENLESASEACQRRSPEDTRLVKLMEV